MLLTEWMTEGFKSNRVAESDRTELLYRTERQVKMFLEIRTEKAAQALS